MFFICSCLLRFAILTPSFVFQPKKKVGKKVAAPPLAVKKVEVKKEVNPLFEKRSRNFGIGMYVSVFNINRVESYMR